jgi:hypothetical protein
MSERTGVVPQGLADAPSLPPHLNYYYQQFQELGKSRRYTYGEPLAIPISEIHAHCEFYRLDEAERNDLYTYVRLFDDNWLEIRAEKSAAEAAKKKT